MYTDTADGAFSKTLETLASKLNAALVFVAAMQPIHLAIGLQEADYWYTPFVFSRKRPSRNAGSIVTTAVPKMP